MQGRSPRRRALRPVSESVGPWQEFARQTVQIKAQGVQVGTQAVGTGWALPWEQLFPPHGIGARGQRGGCSPGGRSASLTVDLLL